MYVLNLPFSVQFLELQVQGIKLGFKLGVLAGKVPDDQENAECNQGDPAKGHVSPGLVPGHVKRG